MNGGLIIFIVAILMVVMIHEAGHFLMAKLFNFKATKFFLGFGPTIWSFKRGETEYGIKALPLGGFVKIVGMNPYEEIDPEDESRSYANKPRWQRALVLLGGPATHWPLAFLILLVLAMSVGFPTGNVSNEIQAVDVIGSETESPALSAGIEPGDRIVGIDGRRTEEWRDIRAFIRSNPGEEVHFIVERDGREREVGVELGQAIFNAEGALVDYAPPGETLRSLEPGEESAGFLGVSPKEVYEKESLIPAAGTAATITWDFTVQSVKGAGAILAMPFDGELWSAMTADGEREVGEGPIGIVGASRIASGSFAAGRFLELMGLIAGFTVFVGLMNLLPLPPLDGGHLAVLVFEEIKLVPDLLKLRSNPLAMAEPGFANHPVDIRKLIPLAAAVISFFVVLFIAVLYLDLARPIKVPF
ncbi:MAG TPA: site-2 protease family protein [Actinomycetota bacterium]|nr:site-2 protease family protein [Actinomycetota bacterium]